MERTGKLVIIIIFESGTADAWCDYDSTGGGWGRGRDTLGLENFPVSRDAKPYGSNIRRYLFLTLKQRGVPLRI